MIKNKDIRLFMPPTLETNPMRNFRNLAVSLAYAVIVASCVSISGEKYQVKDKPALITGKARTGPTLPLPEWADQSPGTLELQAALLNRGLFLDLTGQIRFLQKAVCGGYSVHAHRGHHKFYENSISSLTHAIADGFDGI